MEVRIVGASVQTCSLLKWLCMVPGEASALAAVAVPQQTTLFDGSSATRCGTSLRRSFGARWRAHCASALEGVGIITAGSRTSSS